MKLSIVAQQPIAPGVYVIDIATDVDSTVLTCTIPTVSGVVSSCAGATTSIFAAPVGEAGAISAIDVSIDGQPHTVSAKVSRDGSVIASHDFTPTYTPSYPNGPDCPGQCKTAEPESFTL